MASTDPGSRASYRLTMRTVLVVGRHPSVLNDAESEVRRLGFGFLGATDEETALALARANSLDALVLGGGISYETRRRLAREIRHWHPAIEVIEPAGPGLVGQAVLATFGPQGTAG